MKAAGAPSPRTEGEDNGEWIIVDCGAAVVHVMQPAIREYYHLEELWGEKPVRMKIAEAASRRRGRLRSMPTTATRGRALPEARKLAAKRPVVRTAGGKSGPASAKPAAKKSAQKTAHARPSAKARRPRAKTAGARR